MSTPLKIQVNELLNSPVVNIYDSNINTTYIYTPLKIQVNELLNSPVVNIYDSNINMPELCAELNDINILDTSTINFPFKSVPYNSPVYIQVPDYIYNNQICEMTMSMPMPPILTRSIDGVEMTTQQCLDRYNYIVQNLK
jgi:hypothetical protein